MNGSKTVRMTSEELRGFLARGESRSRPLPSAQEPDLSDPDNPEASAALLAMLRAPDRFPVEPAQVVTSLRLDADILEAFRLGGEGWQARINDALRDWLRTHSA